MVVIMHQLVQYKIQVGGKAHNNMLPYLVVYIYGKEQNKNKG